MPAAADGSESDLMRAARERRSGNDSAEVEFHAALF